MQGVRSVIEKGSVTRNMVIFFIAIFILRIFIVPEIFASAIVDRPSRVINLVYDDSGSMIEDEVGYNDKWCQAKYALEVFSAMLDENDTMNVYTMSDFVYSDVNYKNVDTHLSLSGASSASENVSQIHNMLTNASGTPFSTVKKAYEDLANSGADEKWLVVLTDGIFADERNNSMNISEVDKYFSAKNDDVSVIYLAIGSSALSISKNEAKNIYSYSASNSTDILGRLTEMSNRIFERNRLEVDPASGKFSFDIPMGELIVFAQGKKINIEGISGSNGTKFTSDTAPVEVKYSETAALNYKDDKKVVVNDNLEGKIAYYTGDFDAGEYIVDANGATTIEVYYRPNVDIAIQLVNSEGTHLSTTDPIPQGTYTLEYGFVKPGTNEFLAESELLGNIDFAATVNSNGTSDGKQYKNGDAISVTEGSLDIDATAEYLDYNTVSTSLHYDVFQDKPLLFDIKDDVEYVIEKQGFKEPISPMLLTVRLQDRELTKDEWNALETPEIEYISHDNLGDLVIEKSNQIGVFEITPSIYNNSPADNALGDYTFHVNLQQKIGMDVWSGQTDGVLHISDGMSFIDRHPWFPYFVISLLVLLILFLIWITRKVLPKNIKIQSGSTQFRVSPNPFPQEGIEAECAFKRKSKKLEISSPPCEQNYEAQCSITLVLKPVDRRYVKSKNRRICIVEIKSSGVVYNVTVNGVVYAKDSHGKWVEEAYVDTESKRKMEQIVKNANVEMKTGTQTDVISRCECQLKHI